MSDGLKFSLMLWGLLFLVTLDRLWRWSQDGLPDGEGFWLALNVFALVLHSILVFTRARKEMT